MGLNWPKKHPILKIILFAVVVSLQTALFMLIENHERIQPVSELPFGQERIALSYTRTHPGMRYKEIKAFEDGGFLLACSDGFLRVLDGQGSCVWQLRAPYDEVAVQGNSIALKEGNTIYLYSKQGEALEERPFERGLFAFGPQISCTNGDSQVAIESSDTASHLRVNGQIVSSVYSKGLRSKPLSWFLFSYHVALLFFFVILFLVKNLDAHMDYWKNFWKGFYHSKTDRWL